METNFNEIKQEILRRAKEAKACKFEYSRAYVTENLSELSEVIKDNFYWVCTQGVLTVDLIEQYKEDFSANDIYANQDVERGYLLCDSATVKAYGNTIVKAYGNSKVEAYGNAKVEACDNSTIRAFDNTSITVCNNVTVEAYGNAYCTSYNTIDCKLFNHAIYYVRDTNTIYYADSNIKFVKQ